jgi:hypothetical protein
MEINSVMDLDVNIDSRNYYIRRSNQFAVYLDVDIISRNDYICKINQCADLQGLFSLSNSLSFQINGLSNHM